MTKQLTSFFRLLLIAFILLTGCSKSGNELNPDQKDPASTTQNMMDVNINGTDYSLYKTSATVKTYTTTNSSYKTVLIVADRTGFDQNIHIDFEVPYPKQSAQVFQYGLFYEPATKAIFNIQRITKDYIWVSNVTPSGLTNLKWSDGTFDVTNFQESKVIQGKFSLKAETTDGQTVDAKGVFNFSF